jgi:zinc transport system substrate-binding protein
VVTTFSACAGNGESGRPTVVASFYPLAYVAERVGGDRVEVRNLAPPGVEPHDLELSPRDIDRVEDARLVLVLGDDFQPAVERAAERNAATVSLIEKLDVQGRDPHVWLDPVLMTKVVSEVAGALIRLDPTHRDEFADRAQRLVNEVAALDGRYRAGLAACSRREIVTAHEAFGRLAERYGLTETAIAGLSPEAEPDAARLAELTDLIRRNRVTTVFSEELVSPRVADALAREAGVRTDVLDPLEGLAPRDIEAGATYFTVMDKNLAKLRAALGCG